MVLGNDFRYVLAVVMPKKTCLLVPQQSHKHSLPFIEAAVFLGVCCVSRLIDSLDQYPLPYLCADVSRVLLEKYALLDLLLVQPANLARENPV